MKKQFAFLCTLLLVCSNLIQAQKSSNKPPNIIVIFSDDHTQQTISAYGKSLMQTPNIDRIANEGMIAKNAFVTNSICAPSRAVLLTGKYNHLNGLKDNSPRRFFDGNQQQVQNYSNKKSTKPHGLVNGIYKHFHQVLIFLEYYQTKASTFSPTLLICQTIQRRTRAIPLI